MITPEEVIECYFLPFQTDACLFADTLVKSLKTAGYVIVKSEPTEEMLKNMSDVSGRLIWNEKEVYKAMTGQANE